MSGQVDSEPILVERVLGVDKMGAECALPILADADQIAATDRETLMSWMLTPWQIGTDLPRQFMVRLSSEYLSEREHAARATAAARALAARDTAEGQR